MASNDAVSNPVQRSRRKDGRLPEPLLILFLDF